MLHTLQARICTFKGKTYVSINVSARWHSLQNHAVVIQAAQFRARADEVRGESLQFKRGELIKFRKRGGQKLLSKHVQRVKKNFSGSRKFFCSHQSEKK